MRLLTPSDLWLNLQKYPPLIHILIQESHDLLLLIILPSMFNFSHESATDP
jgi:hypothetical protein